MLEAIVFVGAMLCVETEKKILCQNVIPPKETKTVFSRTVTDWQKIPSETNYNIDKEVKFEQTSIRTRH